MPIGGVFATVTLTAARDFSPKLRGVPRRREGDSEYAVLCGTTVWRRVATVGPVGLVGLVGLVGPVGLV